MISFKNIIKNRESESGFRLHIASLSVAPEECVAITGPSGCGKSTALDLIGMLLRPDAAESMEMCFGGKRYDADALWKENASDTMARIRKEYMGYVLQTGELLPFLTVSENIELTSTGGAEEAYHLMESLKIEHKANAYPSSISIGERQRAAIARALASSPKLLLADEPTAALDPNLARSVMSLFLECARKKKTAVLMVSHDVHLVEEFRFRRVNIRMLRDEAGLLAELG